MTETTGDVTALTGDQPSSIIFKKRGAKPNGKFRKRPVTPTLSPSDDDSSDSSGSGNESSHGIKRRKKDTGVVTASSASNRSSHKELFATSVPADRNIPIAGTNDATKHTDWFDEDSKVSQSSKSRVMPQETQIPDGTYKGLANQTSFIRKNPNAPTRSVGPIKAATNIRTITVTDYSPDVCKDFKQTGFCGFGDNW